MKNLICCVCRKTVFSSLTSMSFSVWEKKGQKLERLEKKYELIECKFCGHVMCEGDYSEEAFNLLYSRDYQDDTIASRPSIYRDIATFNLPYLLSLKKLKIADFGGSSGDFVIVLSKNERHKLDFNCSNICVYDFRLTTEKARGVTFHEINLNNISETFCLNSIREFNYAFCIHTLEHLVDPREFLTTLYDISSDKEFYLYIEVPANELLSISQLASLVCPQHKHYFTLTNLVKMCTDIGYELIRTELVETEGVPRIKCLVHKNAVAAPRTRIVNYLHDREQRIKKTTDLIIKSSSTLITGLWGIGNELYEMMKRFPDIYELAKNSNIFLIDKNLAGTTYLDIPIYSPKEKVGTVENIIIMPKEAQTIKAIETDAVKLGYTQETIINPYINNQGEM